jgi:histidinol-phosphate aminotransferase
MSELSRRRFNMLLGATAAMSAVPALAQPSRTILLNSNENPLGPSPAAMRAVRDSLSTVFRYPDDAENELMEAVAHAHGVSTSEVLLGNGSSDILRLAASAFRGKLVTATPTFEALWSHMRGQEIVRVPLDATHAHDLDAMLAAAARGAKLVYLCNPNNPTATITPKVKVRAFLEALPADVAVLVDEAYHHYAESADYESCAGLISTYPSLIVLRTFSKIHAMAGLRCGYAIAQRPMIARLGAEQAYNAMNLLACVAATASLKDADHVAVSRRRNREIRAWTVDELSKLGYRTLPSHANFVMIDMRKEVRPVIAAFRERGIRVGRLFPPMPQHLRVTLGTEDEMRRFITAFREVR